MREMEFDNPLASGPRASFMASPTTPTTPQTFEMEDSSPVRSHTASPRSPRHPTPPEAGQIGLMQPVPPFPGLLWSEPSLLTQRCPTLVTRPFVCSGLG